MQKPLSFGRFGIELTTHPRPAGTPRADMPLRLLMLGDWGGRASRRVAPPANRRPIRVDRDNLDEVIRQLGVELHVPAGTKDNARRAIRFTELDDFHPDRLFQRLEMFQAFRDLRERLTDPSTFAEAAAAMRGWASAGPEESPKPEPSKAPPANLLEQILGGSVDSPVGNVAPSGENWQAVIRQLVQPYLVSGIDDAQQAEMLALVDHATGEHLRALLHHPDFQALEAAWRDVHFLVRRLDTDTALYLYLLDATKQELAADVLAAEDLGTTGLYQLLVRQTVGTPGAVPWGLVMGHYTFDQSRPDVETLGRVARIARQGGVPFLAAADDRVLGCRSLAATADPDDWREPVDAQEAEAWAALRRLPEAAYLGLALPRFLLRLPYGRETSPTELFDFEEMPQGSRHADYLWGHPAVACGYLLAEAFNRFGWSFRPGDLQEIDGLPLHVYTADGESRLKPCAEAALGERAVAAILGKGLMPLVTRSGRDAVQVPRLQALADPATTLAGRWDTTA